MGPTCHQLQYCVHALFISSRLSSRPPNPLCHFSHLVLVSPLLPTYIPLHLSHAERSANAPVLDECMKKKPNNLLPPPPSASLYPGAKPALDPHHGERGAVGQGQLHLRGRERVWIHQPHVHSGRGRSVPVHTYILLGAHLWGWRESVHTVIWPRCGVDTGVGRGAPCALCLNGCYPNLLERLVVLTHKNDY